VESNQHAHLNAMDFSEEQKADHVTVAPDLKVNSFWSGAFIVYFLFGFKSPRLQITIGLIKVVWGLVLFSFMFEMSIMTLPNRNNNVV